MDREDDRHALRHAAEAADDRAQRFAGVHVRRPVKGHVDVTARLDAEPLRRLAGAGLVEVPRQRVDHHVADQADALGGNALAPEVLVRVGLGVSSRSASASVTRRLISSGIVRSNERRPASTWATRTPSFAATRVQAIVEFTSPTTTSQSGAKACSTGSKRSITCAVWAAWLPEPTSRFSSGGGDLQLVEEHLRHALVVVLTRVHQALLEQAVPRGHRAHHGRDLHEVRAGADDVQDLERAGGGLWQAGSGTRRAREGPRL